MQLPRVIIAAVFFVIGALIAVPAIMRSTSSSNAADNTPASSSGISASATPSASSRATATATRKTSRSPSPVLPHITVTAKPTRPSPSTSASRTPVIPLRAVIGPVTCPGRGVKVTVTNIGDRIQDYAIETDGSANTAGRLNPGESYHRTLALKEDQRTEVAVTWNNETVKAVTRTANCSRPGAGAQRLPHTGPGDAALYAKTATGIAAMITGAIIFWWGGIWPRRREQIFPSRRRSG